MIFLWLRTYRFSPLRVVPALSALAMLAGCASVVRLTPPKVSDDPCTHADWFEIGRIDGIAGIPVNSSAYVGKCLAKGKPFAVDLYNAGWNTGLVEYCTPERGFDAGRAGQEYAGVCPANVESDFMERLLLGKKIAKLERDNAKIETELDQAMAQVNQISAVEKEAVSSPAAPSILQDALNRVPLVGGPTADELAQQALVRQNRKKELQSQLQALRDRRARNDVQIKILESL